MDKAGQEYWNREWANAASVAFDPRQTGIRNYGDRVLGQLLQRAFAPLAPTSSTIVEAGCADSTYLTYLGRELGYRIAGVDYSPNGCERLRRHLDRMGLTARIECCDVFAPPREMLGAFDGLMSLGLVEHFTDTASIVTALAALVRPAGRVFTLTPNMQGMVGVVQWLAGPSTYRVHEALSPRDLERAHSSAGLRIIESGYMLPVGFGVVNFNEAASRPLYLARRLMVAALARLSWAAWVVDEKLMRLPKTALLSPYSYCIAERA
jgi:2-polyprenyl-3-methyl-5-hydroxy-6-metoxy-1,4-benzoquinol methylase